MPKQPLITVASIKFNENGKSYVAQCDLPEVSIGDRVIVSMGDNSLLQGVIVGLSRKRWSCRCNVISKESDHVIELFEQPENHNDLVDIYDAITHEQGEDTYLGDGVWLKPNGKMVEK